MSTQMHDVDLTNCDREPIHRLGHIQAFGALIAVNADWFLAQRSANLQSILGTEREPEVGVRLSQIIAPRGMERLRSAVAALIDPDQTERLFGVDLLDDGGLFDCAIHTSGHYTIIEIEPHEEGKVNRQIGLLRPIVARLEKIGESDRLLAEAARQLRLSLDIDRVMVYRFHKDLSGEVVAESKRDDLESFHGLRYPKTDIPAQARELYKRNRFRIISDVEEAPIPIEPGVNAEGEPIDLSMSTLRAVSPIHIEYLHNMGVGASLSISIIIGGELWGLFACHHYGPKVLPYSQRTSAELFSELFSLILERSLFREREELRESGRKVHDRLMRDIAAGTPLSESLPLLTPVIQQIIPHDGASVFIDDVYDARGAAPNEEEFRAVAPALNAAATSRVLATDSLQQRFPKADRFADRAAGALVIPVSRTPRDYLVLWRRGLTQTVLWAGNPEKPVEYGPNGARLTPRKSFEAWQESVEGRSPPWTDGELQVADGLRVTLLEIILRLTDEAVKERARAQSQQELLIAELNHRVRNILNLIRGLISQSKREAGSIEEFSDIIGGRISSLAMAHDNITKTNWSPAPLRELIETEAHAYLDGRADRLNLTGPEVLITPEAYTVLALVMHEMITNSAKYGSLSDSTGQLEIVVERNKDGSLQLFWREKGGPPVKPPTRRGFGSTIVERSIPFELGGETKIEFKLSGVEAEFCVPARHVTWSERTTPQSDSRSRAAADTALLPGSLPESILLVEDSMIIALDTEDSLRELGVGRVMVESTVAGALDSLEKHTPDLAILDYNLGKESSERVAEELSRRGILFWLATGYGEMADRVEDIGGMGVLTKPYGKAELIKILSTSNPEAED
ncbi:HWE histidine kinase domain-containing protein [Erythrobacter sp. SD-21]|uniref:HWE histidine kinase domain-containing protein n=1 Tax=Erythrobacter sp. SD-21 TaxID=161528 RepID=UPI000153F7B7|nr:HWE histidine kinase domain-containing protein [Erythrobacter sp. SD-21]EDL48432.1 Bacteriophytochrome (light-regulated signal transduction histidine kinase), PhyB5 [Erythrobacter sp. SD-21]